MESDNDGEFDDDVLVGGNMALKRLIDQCTEGGAITLEEMKNSVHHVRSYKVQWKHLNHLTEQAIEDTKNDVNHSETVML